MFFAKKIYQNFVEYFNSHNITLTERAVYDKI